MHEVAVLDEIDVESTPIDDSESLYEVVNGQRVEIAPMAFKGSLIATRLSHEIMLFTDPRSLGMVATEALFILDNERNLRRRPDLAFVAKERLRIDLEDDPPAWDVIPNLAVEVVSPTDHFVDVIGKIGEYFSHGVEAVWLVVPSRGRVWIFEAIDRVTIRNRDAEIDGGAVLPGFRLAVSALFDGIIGPPSR